MTILREFIRTGYGGVPKLAKDDVVPLCRLLSCSFVGESWLPALAAKAKKTADAASASQRPRKALDVQAAVVVLYESVLASLTSPTSTGTGNVGVRSLTDDARGFTANVLLLPSKGDGHVPTFAQLAQLIDSDGGATTEFGQLLANPDAKTLPCLQRICVTLVMLLKTSKRSTLVTVKALELVGGLTLLGEECLRCLVVAGLVEQLVAMLDTHPERKTDVSLARSSTNFEKRHNIWI